jgi:hypothetical protein
MEHQKLYTFATYQRGMEICGGAVRAVKEDKGEGIKMWKVIRERSDGSSYAFCFALS